MATRDAKVGDLLVTTKFSNSITRGFAEVGEPNVAVCILPGTEISFDREVKCDHALGLFPTRKMKERTATFRQVNMDNPYEHHDALEFPGGQVVLLTRLCEGQHATVLQLPAKESPTPSAADEQAQTPRAEAVDLPNDGRVVMG